MPRNVNQNPEQIARDRIDDRLRAAGWRVQDKDALDFNAGLGIAVREYQTDIGPADYVLFVDRQAVGVVEAKPDTWGAKLTTVDALRQSILKKAFSGQLVPQDPTDEPATILLQRIGAERASHKQDGTTRKREARIA